MKTIQGDLLKLAQDGQFDVILHGCNCFCVMGAGIAQSVKQHFPEAFQADYRTEKGDRDKLGSYSSTLIEKDSSRFTLVNAYTQYHWRGQGNKADYDAIRSVFKAVRQEFSGQRIGYPLIGAGLAGGDWTIIKQIIDEELESEDHTLVKFIP